MLHIKIHPVFFYHVYRCRQLVHYVLYADPDAKAGAILRRDAAAQEAGVSVEQWEAAKKL